MAGLSQAAAQLGCSVETIRRRIKTGELHATKVAGVWDIDLPEATDTLQDGHTDVLERLVDQLTSEVEELRRQLEVREREIGQLHILLGQRQLESGTSSRPWWKFWSG